MVLTKAEKIGKIKRLLIGRQKNNQRIKQLKKDISRLKKEFRSSKLRSNKSLIKLQLAIVRKRIKLIQDANKVFKKKILMVKK